MQPSTGDIAVHAVKYPESRDVFGDIMHAEDRRAGGGSHKVRRHRSYQRRFDAVAGQSAARLLNALRPQLPVLPQVRAWRPFGDKEES